MSAYPEQFKRHIHYMRAASDRLNNDIQESRTGTISAVLINKKALFCPLLCGGQAPCGH